jgi:hypothetical protein
MKSAWKLCAIVFLASSLVAQTNSEPKPRKTKAAITAADVQALRDALASQQAALAQQQQQIQELRDILQRKDQAVQQAQTTASDAAGKADAAQAQASQQQQTVGELKTDVSDLKTNLLNTTVTIQEAQKSMSETPTSLHYKGITITPGGFLAAEFVRRSRALGADATPLNALTMPGASQSHVSEFFGSGRQSRLSMLAQGQLKNTKIAGYYEADFLGAGITSNNNQTNSYVLRQRQAYAQAAFAGGWTLTGGQMWTLLTETKHGVDNRTEAVPMTIDPNYTAGFSFARQYGLRLSKSFNNKVWLAVSMENPQATVTTHTNAANFLLGSAGSGGSLYNNGITACATTLSTAGTTTTASTTCTPASSYSFNPAPDIIAKLAFEPGFGHYEVFGIYSRFRDRVFPCEENFASAGCGSLTAASAAGAFNSSRNGGGGGVNARWSFYNKHIDFGLHAFGGRGEGRYSATGLPDAAIHGDGTLDLIRTYQGLATLEWHSPKLDVYFNAGADYAGRAVSFDPVSGKQVGYGAPSFKNSGCYTEVAPSVATGFIPSGLGSCTADTRVLVEGTVGVWFKPYDGSKEKVNRGRIQWGPQFSYVDRETWSGAGSPNEPHGLDAMIFTSFRYYLP